mgnify:CR=1 FL=1
MKCSKYIRTNDVRPHDHIHTGNAAHVQEVISGELRYIPVVMSLSLIPWGFIESTRSENASIWR